MPEHTPAPKPVCTPKEILEALESNIGCLWVVNEEKRLFSIETEQDIDPLNPRDDENVGRMVCCCRRYSLGDEQPKMSPKEALYRDVYERLHTGLFGDKLELVLEILEHQPDTKQVEIRVNRNKDYPVVIKTVKSAKGDIKTGVEAYQPDEETFGELFDLMSPESFRILTDKIRFLWLPLYLLDHSSLSISVEDFNDRWDSGRIGYICVTPSEEDLVQNGKETYLNWLRQEVQLYDRYLNRTAYGLTFKELNEDGMFEETDSVWNLYDDEGAEIIEEIVGSELTVWEARKGDSALSGAYRIQKSGAKTVDIEVENADEELEAVIRRLDKENRPLVYGLYLAGYCAVHKTTNHRVIDLDEN